MGFEQYHEPAGELNAEVRTFRPNDRLADRNRGNRLARAARRARAGETPAR